MRLFVTILGVILGIILFVLLFPAGVKADIFGGDPAVYARLFGLSIKIYPKESKKGGKEDHAKKKSKSDKKPDKTSDGKTEEKGEKPKITFDMVMEYISFASRSLSKIAKGIYVPHFMLEARLHNDDPSKTAMLYGSACAALELAVPRIEKIITVKNRDIRIYPDFMGSTDYNLSITVMAVPLHLLIVAAGIYIKWKKLNNKAVQNEQCK